MFASTAAEARHSSEIKTSKFPALRQSTSTNPHQALQILQDEIPTIHAAVGCSHDCASWECRGYLHFDVSDRWILVSFFFFNELTRWGNRTSCITTVEATTTSTTTVLTTVTQTSTVFETKTREAPCPASETGVLDVSSALRISIISSGFINTLWVIV